MICCPYHVRFVSLLVVLATIPVAHTIDFAITNKAENTKGAKLFDEKLGVGGAKRQMSLAQINIWNLALKQDVTERKKVKKVTLVIFEELENEEASSYNQTDKVNGFYEIHLSATHFELCKSFVKKEIVMLIYYEMAHILQWTANDDIAAKAVKDGIAAFVVLRTTSKPERWVSYGEGIVWDASHDVTAQFLVYCNNKFNRFVESLNKMMETSYTDDYFVQLTTKTIDQLWVDYKTNPKDSIEKHDQERKVYKKKAMICQIKSTSC